MPLSNSVHQKFPIYHMLLVWFKDRIRIRYGTKSRIRVPTKSFLIHNTVFDDVIILYTKNLPITICSWQCGGFGMFIPDPTFFHPGSRIRTVSIPDPGSSSKNLIF